MVIRFQDLLLRDPTDNGERDIVFNLHHVLFQLGREPYPSRERKAGTKKLSEKKISEPQNQASMFNSVLVEARCANIADIARFMEDYPTIQWQAIQHGNPPQSRANPVLAGPPLTGNDNALVPPPPAAYGHNRNRSCPSSLAQKSSTRRRAGGQFYDPAWQVEGQEKKHAAKQEH
ncbi:predicted protein [Uncinocarpus reesii 1704]|uniref:Uncharacterized protein n=1 Tax=Uncinocarpus reesii (strain UAMH 1704) TaxID=336963 RepID=C4JEK1_UNCRE|nr:uncharacterized protein UREG_00840 [Uncinocarpus reesii 1704]EEP75993.1 predicted protein [Uncinocarpus reesii 1704]